ncbi:MAG: hypothetical protein V3T22_04360 [Planctomycetota bacterium]
MRRPFTLTLIALAAACASAPHPPDHSGTFALEAAEVARARSAARLAAAHDPPVAADALPDFAALRSRALQRHGEAATLQGLLPVPTDELRALAADEAALERRLRAGPLETEELLQLIWLRDPALAARRSALAAELEGYDQVRLLEDVIDRYRSFVRQSRVRIGVPTRADGLDSQSELAPYPAIEALRGELVERGVEQRWHELRAATVQSLASALVQVAHLTWIATDHEIAGEHLILLEAQEPVTRARVAAGRTRQADLLTLQSELERLKSRLAELDAEQDAQAAELARLLDRDAAPAPAAVATTLIAVADPAQLRATLRAAQPELAAARAAWERSLAALRLSEVVALGPTDLGLARFERGLAGEAGVARERLGPPSLPGVTPGVGLGPREALLRGMRERVEQREHEWTAVLRRCLAAQEQAWKAREAADLRLGVYRDEMTPRAWAAYEGIAVAWTNGQASFLEFIDGADRLHQVQLGVARAQRDARLADAALLLATGSR